MKTIQVKELFLEKFYNPTYKDWRVDNVKAAKDIVGENYEDFRKEYWEACGFEVKQQIMLYGIFDVDTLIYKNGELVAIEEDKGHYCDSSMFTRALINMIQIVKHCVENNKPVPHLILSSSTTYNLWKDKRDLLLTIVDEKYIEMVKERFIYLPLCEHSRVSAPKYFQSLDNCFELNDELIDNQNKFVMGILNGV
jgi:hypothetical protein|tara:strand:- start:1475 stop:2059 length:585 start_codon:yes stop_codon:yes gene_type:complete